MIVNKAAGAFSTFDHLGHNHPVLNTGKNGGIHAIT